MKNGKMYLLHSSFLLWRSRTSEATHTQSVSYASERRVHVYAVCCGAILAYKRASVIHLGTMHIHIPARRNATGVHQSITHISVHRCVLCALCVRVCVRWGETRPRVCGVERSINTRHKPADMRPQSVDADDVDSAGGRERRTQPGGRYSEATMLTTTSAGVSARAPASLNNISPFI